MAKKKTKAAKKEVPAKKEKKKSSSMGWIIAAIVVIVIAAYLLMQPGKVATPTETTQQPTTAAEKGTLTTSEAPGFNSKCVVANSPTGPTIGVVPGSMVNDNNVVTVTFKNNGRVTVGSSYFEFADQAGKKVYKLNSDSVEPGATVKYTIDLNQVATEMGSQVNAWTIYPAVDGKACLNARVYVIKQSA